MMTVPIDVAALLFPLVISQNYWRGTLVNAGLTMAIFAAGGLYQARRHVSILDELPSIVGRLLASAAVVAIIAAERHSSVEYVGGFMRGVAISASLVIVGRALSRALTILVRKQRWVEHNAIIIGSGPIALELARLLRRYPQYGLRFVGCVDVTAQQDPASLPLLGGLNDLEKLVRVLKCEVLVIADPDCPESDLMDTLLLPQSSRCDLWEVPRLWGSRSQGGYPDHIGAIPIVKVGDISLSGPRWAIKRASDVVFAGLALLLLSPVLLLCAIATLIDGGGASSSTRSGSAGSGSPSTWSSSGRCARSTKPSRRRTGRSRTTGGSARSGGSCAAPHWTSFPNCGTSCAAT